MKDNIKSFKYLFIHTHSSCFTCFVESAASYEHLFWHFEHLSAYILLCCTAGLPRSTSLFLWDLNVNLKYTIFSVDIFFHPHRLSVSSAVLIPGILHAPPVSLDSIILSKKALLSYVARLLFLGFRQTRKSNPGSVYNRVVAREVQVPFRNTKSDAMQSIYISAIWK